MQTSSTQMLETHLFGTMQTFNDLEAELNQASEPVRFELLDDFVIAYFITQPIYQAQTIWTSPSIPKQILTRLGIKQPKRFGIDYVMESVTGTLTVIHNAFDNVDDVLLQQFLNGSIKAYCRAVVTNTFDIPSNMQKLNGYYWLGKPTFEYLRKQDFIRMQCRFKSLKALDIPKQMGFNRVSSYTLHDNGFCG